MLTPEALIPAMALLAVLTRELLWLCAAGIALSSLDDLAVDFVWLWRVAFRKAPPLPPEPAEAGRFAILIPAWDESAVIGAMLARLLATLEHPDYHVFVGYYPNDPETEAAIRAMGDRRVQAVSTGHAGPTTKADCLNRLWRAVLAEEAESGRRFKAVVLHDAEDLVHPLSLRLYDRAIPGLAMVQLPVLPLVDRNSRWISGHYIDEFAQSHAKDMMVRAALRAPVPSAGVGTAIDRAVLERIAGPAGEPFDASSLTEDYEIGHKLHRMGLEGRMLRVRVKGELVATREFFPADLEGAIRQKSRWLTGIALAGWDRLGWSGGWRERWMLLRDRKGLFTAAVTMLAYGASLLMLTQMAMRAMLAEQTGQALPPLMGEGGVALCAFLILNAGLLAWRLLLRAGFTARDYGWAEGLRAVPRAVMGNGINFLSALRAVDRYRAALESGHAVRWDKTPHRFPAGEGANG
ncbi:glycosyl transferase family protein [Sandaracinobacter sp. RS1-74]|uniref:glycosyl transferase family protein n=1 Tax=Sandaracinobacteroides sayramensis TaxID=2913411 RepID=UPI001EDAAFCF|nr:glycosyl transferase family protein [Sandaracinobacteroides sayramensis]